MFIPRKERLKMLPFGTKSGMKSRARTNGFYKKRRFEYVNVETNTQKFWHIEAKDFVVSIHYGRINSAPRVSTHYFTNNTEMMKYIDKKIVEKSRKGYLEVKGRKRKVSKKKKPNSKDQKSKKKSKSNTNAQKKSKAKANTNAQKKSKAKANTNAQKKSRRKCGNPHNSGKSVWSVKKNGLMLAHTFKDNKTGKIKNAPKGYPQAPNGWWLSEKYDGYRALWDGKTFYSRGANVFNVPKWFKAFMPPGVALDGELFLGRECFEKCGIFRRKIPDTTEWEKMNVKYQVFDSPTHPGNFEERQKFIKQIVKDRCKCNRSKLGIPKDIKCPLIYTNQIKVKTEADVQRQFNKLVGKGAEGVMLRAPRSPYESKRSSLLLKVKQLFDDECKIIGYKGGTGKYKGLLGAFKCQLVKHPNIKFDISGMDDNIRKHYKKTHPIGTIVTFTYMGLSNRGVPRHPNYQRIRKSI